MELLVEALTAFCREVGFDKTYWVGYSGGVDSHVLLHLLAKIRASTPFNLKAVHINHGLSPLATEWVAHTQRVCQVLDIDFSSFTIDATSPTKSPEEIARERRYAMLAELIASQDVLLTGHHQDDQAETVLLQLLRGAGPKGLAAMPKMKPFGDGGLLARPLLEVTRAKLEEYARQNQLSWIDDESNSSHAFFRNYLRHDILPRLKTRWPSVTQTLARVAKNCAETEEVLKESIAEHYESVQGSVENTLSIKKLLKLSGIFQRQILRMWLSEQHFSMPSAIKIKHIQHDMLLAKSDKLPCVKWAKVEVRRYKDNLYAMSPLLPPSVANIILTGKEIVPLPAGIKLEETTVRFRQGGEVIQLHGETFHRELKKLFQHWGVPPWLRERVPLVYFKNELIAVLWEGTLVRDFYM